LIGFFFLSLSLSLQSTPPQNKKKTFLLHQEIKKSLELGSSSCPHTQNLSKPAPQSKLALLFIPQLREPSQSDPQCPTPSQTLEVG